jgi:hypothetical protein
MSTHYFERLYVPLAFLVKFSRMARRSWSMTVTISLIAGSMIYTCREGRFAQ